MLTMQKEKRTAWLLIRTRLLRNLELAFFKRVLSDFDANIFALLQAKP